MRPVGCPGWNSNTRPTHGIGRTYSFRPLRSQNAPIQRSYQATIGLTFIRVPRVPSANVVPTYPVYQLRPLRIRDGLVLGDRVEDYPSDLRLGFAVTDHAHRWIEFVLAQRHVWHRFGAHFVVAKLMIRTTISSILHFTAYISSTVAILVPIHLTTLTGNELPRALYRGPSAAVFPRYGTAVYESGNPCNLSHSAGV